jgi:hypothetical protein
MPQLSLKSALPWAIVRLANHTRSFTSTGQCPCLEVRGDRVRRRAVRRRGRRPAPGYGRGGGGCFKGA